MIQTGRIKAYDGLGIVKVDTTTQPGKTIVSAIMTTKAQIPSPANGAADLVYNSTTLGWKAGMSAVSHDVYFGTSFADVNNAQPFAGDLDYNGIVDFKDLSILTQYWLLDPTGTNPYAGVNTIALWTLSIMHCFQKTGRARQYSRATRMQTLSIRARLLLAQLTTGE